MGVAGPTRLFDKSIVATACALGCLFGGHALAADGAGGDDSADALPRYRFKVGQELVYRLTAREDPREKDAIASAPLDHMEWRTFVVRQNDDGSWRLFIRTKITFLDNAGKVRAKRNSLGYVDLHPNGSYAVDDQTAILKRLLPHELFCRLSDRSMQLDQGWSYEPPVERFTYKFAPASRNGMTLKISGVAKTPYDEMHGWQTTRRYDFDLERGFVKRVVVEFKDLGDGLIRDRRTIELDLQSVVEREPAWISQFHAEANDYLAVYLAWSRFVNDATWAHDAAACEPALRKARTLLVAGRDNARLEILQAMYDANLQEHDEHVPWAMKDAATREAFFAQVPKFATDWQAQNLDGGTFRLTDQRGKIVVLDFWSTSCEYCVLAAPQVTQLAAEYRAKGVVFLGMFHRQESDDQQDAKARSLIKSVYQGISHLEARQIAEHYRLNDFGFGYPSLQVLDQSGIVHEVHSGYTADLPQRVRTILDELLSKPAAER